MRLIISNNLPNQKSHTKKKKALTFENAKRLPQGRQNILNGLERKIFSIGKLTQGRLCTLDLASLANLHTLTVRELKY